MDADEIPTFFVRPGLNLLLSQLYPYYEIVVFTAAVADYAEYFVNKIDPHHRVKHVLHREHCKVDPESGVVLKDLSKIGRNLSKTIIVDNLAENFRA